MMKIIKDKRGSAQIEMLLLMGIMIFLMFGAIDYWTILNKVNQVDSQKEYYLDRMRLDGWLSVKDENALKSHLANNLYYDIEINAFKRDENGNFTDTAKESKGASRVLRISHGSPGTVDDLSVSELVLEIKCKPKPQPFFAGIMLGKGVDKEFAISLDGRVLSERVADGFVAVDD